MAQEIGIVKIVSGNVTALAADGSRRSLQVGDRVFADEILITDAGGSIVIAANDGSTIDMGRNDQMSLAEALQDAQPAINGADPSASTTAAEQSAAQIQQALLAGADPTQVAEATAAGAGGAGGGGAGNEGHVAVSVDYLNPVAPVTNGFDTTGPSIAFNDIIPPVLLLNPDQAPAITGNQPPIASADFSSANTPGVPVTLNVLGNDSDPDGTLDPASVQIVGTGGPGQPLVVANQGTWSINPNTGAITFTPINGFTGNPAPISYSVADNLGLRSNPAQVTVDYNQAPVADNDSSLDNVPGVPVTLNVLGNDNDPDGTLDPASVQIVGTGGPGQSLVVANQGTWSINPNTGAITFTPINGFTGNPAPISYSVADNLGLRSNPAQVTVDYNQAPVADNDSSLDNVPGVPVTLNVLGNDNDPDGTLDPASVQIVGTGGPGQSLVVANQGTWSINPNTGAITFTPINGFTGNPAPISYSVADNLGLRSNPAQVTVDYNQAPVADNDSSLDNVPGVPVTLNVLGNDNDPDGTLDPASVQIVGTGGPGQSLVVANQGTWSINPNTGAITFTPINGFTGNPAPISYSVADNLGLRSNPAQVTVDYNQAPVADNDSSLDNVPGVPVTLNVLGNDSDPDGTLDPASVQIVGTGGPGQSLVVANQGTWSINPNTGAITFTPINGFTGNPAPISYSVADNLGLRSNDASVDVTYTSVASVTSLVVDETNGTNGQPLSSDGSLQINGHAPASVVLDANNATWDSITHTLKANDGSYQITVTNGAYTFTLLEALNHVGTGNPEPFNFSAVLTDQNGAVANAAFTVTVYDDGPKVQNSNGELNDVAGQTLTGLIDYDLGFDGFGNSGGVTLINNNGALTSLSDSISYLIDDKNHDGLQELYAFVDKGVAGLDGSDRMVFSLLPTADGAVDGAYKLVLHDVLDMPAASPISLPFNNASIGPAGQVAVGNSLLVEGSNLSISQNHIGVTDGVLDKGEVITYKFGTVDNYSITAPQLVNSVQLNETNVGIGSDGFRWTAYRDGVEIASKTINYVAPSGGGYAPAINVVGGYDTLKIQVTAGNFEVGGLKYTNFSNSPQLQLSFGYTATDGDGDSVSGNFTVDTGALLTTHLSSSSSLLEHPDSVHSV